MFLGFLRDFGLSDKNEPTKVEEDLLKIFSKDQWKLVNHLLISHGRRVCTAKKPNCNECTIKNNCKFFKENTDPKSK